MSTGKQLTALLLLTTALTVPAIANAQSAAPGTGAEGVPAEEDPATDAILADQAGVEGETQPGEDPLEDEDAEAPEISVPGGTIVVTGRRTRNITRAAPQVVTVLDSASIARTGEGDIAGALNRVTGLSTVGNGLVYVRGLGDRYSLALLNGLPLPSPQPLSRVVPLDIFPTSIVASSLVQKTYSANYPGEFGGGVINLTTRAVPDESFVKISGSVSSDTETSLGDGLLYFGSSFDWFGFDDGRRTIRPELQAYFDSGLTIANPEVDQKAILLELGDPNLILLQKTDALPLNLSGGITAGTSFDVFGDGRLGIIATASLSNKYRNRDIISQRALNADLDLRSSQRQFVTDNRVLANAMLGFGLEVGEHRFRVVNLFIRDSLKRASLATSDDFESEDTDLIQDTAWFERQLFNSQFTGELDFGDLEIDLRGGYAQTQREAPYEWEFRYTQPTDGSQELGFLNTLDGQRGAARVGFSDLTEDLYYGGIDLTYQLTDWMGMTVGGAYTDTDRRSLRRVFNIRANNLPDVFGAFRPDNLLGDSLIEFAFDQEAQAAAGLEPFSFTIFDETGDPIFDAGLEILAGYAKAQLEPILGLRLDIGARYEDATQIVTPIGFDGQPSGSAGATLIENDYFLPGATLTWEIDDALQARLAASRTIARPQFRELIFQTYNDPESNREFSGNPRLIDSELTNYEARLEYYFGSGSRASVAGFYKDIENPIEVYSSFSDNDQRSGFANAPAAELYGAEVELQWNKDLFGLGDWWESKRFVAVANYTYTQSELKIPDDDSVIVDPFPLTPQPASNFFRDGAPLTGQSDHLVNLQLGLEDTDKVSQVTMLLSYASERVTSRGTAALPDIYENPGLTLDLVGRQGFTLGGAEMEIKLEARNLTGRGNFEYQDNGTTRIDINRYDVGRSFSLSLSAEF